MNFQSDLWTNEAILGYLKKINISKLQSLKEEWIEKYERTEENQKGNIDYNLRFKFDENEIASNELIQTQGRIVKTNLLDYFKINEDIETKLVPYHPLSLDPIILGTNLLAIASTYNAITNQTVTAVGSGIVNLGVLALIHELRMHTAGYSPIFKNVYIGKVKRKELVSVLAHEQTHLIQHHKLKIMMGKHIYFSEGLAVNMQHIYKKCFDSNIRIDDLTDTIKRCTSSTISWILDPKQQLGVYDAGTTLFLHYAKEFGPEVLSEIFNGKFNPNNIHSQ